jgi:hypothetical protein
MSDKKECIQKQINHHLRVLLGVGSQQAPMYGAIGTLAVLKGLMEAYDEEE